MGKGVCLLQYVSGIFTKPHHFFNNNKSHKQSCLVINENLTLINIVNINIILE
jgi:hypothetical protein